MNSTSKPRSLSISTNLGPRPLHLVDRNVPIQPQSPAVASPASSGSPGPSKDINGSRPHPVRRQSSISYCGRDSDTALSPFGPRHASTRSTSSVGCRSPQSAGSKAGDKMSVGSMIDVTEKGREPHTLAEKFVCFSTLKYTCSFGRLAVLLGMEIFCNSLLGRNPNVWNFVLNSRCMKPNFFNVSCPPPICAVQS